MPPNELKPFPQLPDDDQVYSLDAFGGMRANLDEEDNPFIQCYFSPIRQQPGPNGTGKPYRVRNEQICAEFAIGYLPILFLGKNFRRQNALPHTEWLPLEEVVVELDSGTAEINTIAELRLEKPLTADKNPHAIDRAGLSKIQGTILKTSEKDKKWSEGRLQDFAFLDIELIRFYLTNSSFSCRNLFSGAFAEHRINIDVINTNHEKMELENGNGRFVYRFRYKESDAPALGRILFDETCARKAAQQVYKSMQTDWINSSNGGLAFPRTHFPFRSTTKMTVRGRRLRLKNGDYIFFVHQILGCTAPFPFESLSYFSDVAPGDKPAPEGAREAFQGMTNDKGPAHEPKIKGGHCKSNERPKATSSTIDVVDSERRFDDLIGKELKREKLRDSTHRSSQRPWRYLDDLRNASTGPGTSGHSSAARLSVSEAINPPELRSVDLETFLEALGQIRQLEEHWNIRTIQAGNPEDAYLDEKEEVRCRFPLVCCPERIGLFRRFSYMNSKRTIRKRFICAEIEVGNRYFYLFEAERRPDTTNHRLSILLIYRPDYQQVDGKDFSPMLEKTVDNGGWPSQIGLPDFRRDDISHGKGAKSASDTTKRIVLKIQSKLPKT